MRSHRAYFFFSGLFFFAGAASVVVDFLGLPMVWAFSTLCSLFLVLGCLEATRPQAEPTGEKVPRLGPDDSRAPSLRD